MWTTQYRLARRRRFLSVFGIALSDRGLYAGGAEAPRSSTCASLLGKGRIGQGKKRLERRPRACKDAEYGLRDERGALHEVDHHHVFRRVYAKPGAEGAWPTIGAHAGWGESSPLFRVNVDAQTKAKTLP